MVELLRISGQVVLSRAPAEVLQLLLDFPRYVAIEPRLSSATWLTDPPGTYVGARAQLIAEIAFSVPLVARLVGEPAGVVTILEWSPDRKVACALDSDKFTGWISIEDPDAGTAQSDFRLAVACEIGPKSTTARRALSPFRRVLQDRALRSMERVIRRAEAGLQA